MLKDLSAKHKSYITNITSSKLTRLLQAHRRVYNPLTSTERVKMLRHHHSKQVLPDRNSGTLNIRRSSPRKRTIKRILHIRPIILRLDLPNQTLLIELAVTIVLIPKRLALRIIQTLSAAKRIRALRLIRNRTIMLRHILWHRATDAVASRQRVIRVGRLARDDRAREIEVEDVACAAAAAGAHAEGLARRVLGAVALCTTGFWI